MIEPARTDGDIALCSHPDVAIGEAAAQLLAVRHAWIDLVLLEERPVGDARFASLVAHPTTTGTSVAEDDGLRLVRLDDGVNLGEVVVVTAVNLARLSRPAVVAIATIRSVEPHLEEGPVLRRQLF